MRTATCRLYLAALGLLEERHHRLLSPTECDRRSQYQHRADSQRFALGAVLLRGVVADATGASPEQIAVSRRCDRCARPHGRPRLPGTGLAVSVSHSADYVAVAVTDRESVGVDIEQITDVDFLPLLDHVCTADERPHVRTVTDFFRYWVRKESVLKATGVGLDLPMTSIVVTPPAAPASLATYEGRPPPVGRMADLAPLSGYAGAVTVLGTTDVAIEAGDAATILTAL